MFAVVRCGGKQYRVAVDDVLTVEKLDGDREFVRIHARSAIVIFSAT